MGFSKKPEENARPSPRLCGRHKKPGEKRGKKRGKAKRWKTQDFSLKKTKANVIISDY